MGKVDHKFIDLSGYMFSGKAAASDLIREFEGFYLPNYRSEFDLIRVPGGLADLKRSFEEWSVVGVDDAVRRFELVVKKMASSPKGIDRFFKSGFGYEKKYPGISGYTEEFLATITDASWNIGWPYSLLALNPMEIFLLKVKAVLTNGSPWPEVEYRLCSGDNFLEAARCYVENVLTSGVSDSDHTVILHNALEPFDPKRGFVFFNDIKSIVIDRDVRDIYMTGITYSDGFNDDVNLYSKILGSFDIDIFIRRQELLRLNTDYKESENILRLRFEDLVCDYEMTLGMFFDFMDIDPSSHTKKFEYFDPMKSVSNVGLWKNASKEVAKNIEKIERALPQLCYQ